MTPDEQLLVDLVELLTETRDEVVECLNDVLHGAGYPKYDRRIEYYRDELKRIDDLTLRVHQRLTKKEGTEVPPS